MRLKYHLISFTLLGCVVTRPLLTLESLVPRSTWVVNRGLEGPTVDDTATRSQWVSSYNKKQDLSGPTVDDTATRSQWVSSYSKKQDHTGPTVDDTATRSQWVSSYNKKQDHNGPTVDDTATRSQWVSSYNKKIGHESPIYREKIVDHWIPSGPSYLDLGSFEIEHTSWLAIHPLHGKVSAGAGLVRRIRALFSI